MAEEVPPVQNYFKKSLKPSIILGTVLGLFPRTDLLAPKNHSCCQRFHIGLLAYSGSLFIFLTISATLMIRDYILYFNNAGGNFMEKFGAFVNLSYAFSMAFIYGYHLVGSNRLRTVIADFYETVTQLNTGNLGSRHSWFPISCWCITFTCLILGIVENALYDIQSIAKIKENGHPDITVLSGYFSNNFGHWHDLISYNPVVTVILVIFIKIGTWGWVFADTVAIVICHALSYQFQCLNEAIQNGVVENSKSFGEVVPGTAIYQRCKKAEILSKVKVEPFHSSATNGSFVPCDWETVLNKLWLLMDLTVEVEKYISPLIFTCSVCIGHVLVIIFACIAPDIPVSLSTSNSYHVYYSSIYYCFRVGILTYFLSRVHHSSHQILMSVESCSSSSFAPVVERLEKKLAGNPVGVRIFGTFLITRHFVVSMLSFIFTTEIVLLQMANALRSQK